MDISSVKEVLTDKKGEFNISPHIYFDPYPVAIGDTTTFIIYKPGHEAFRGLSGISLPEEEMLFRKGLTVKLRRLETKEDRLKTIPGGPGNMGANELPLLYKAINEEGKRFGLGEVR